MTIKHISEAGWKAWTKGRGLDDKVLLGRLSALGKTPPGQPDQRLDILGDVDRQLNRLRKDHQADKEMQRHLAEALQEVRQERELATLAIQRERDAQRKQAADEDGDGDTPALLGPKLLEHLKVVRAKEGLSRPAVIGVLGSEVALLMTRTPSTPAQRALLRAHLGGGAVKFLAGACTFERNAFTFALDKSGGGMAKKLKAALKAQTGKTFAVRVRDAETQATDEALDEDASEDEALAGGGQSAAGTQLAAAQDKAPADTRDAALFKTRLATLLPQLKAVQAEGGPRAADLQRLNAEIVALAKSGDMARAHRLLDQLGPQLQRLLAAKAASPQPTAGAVPAQDAAPKPATAAPDKTAKPLPPDLTALRSEAALAYQACLRAGTEATSFGPIETALECAEAAVRRWADGLKASDAAPPADRKTLRTLAGKLQAHRGQVKAAKEQAARIDALMKDIDAAPQTERPPLLARLDTLLASFPS